jgi:hypothetical protein
MMMMVVNGRWSRTAYHGVGRSETLAILIRGQSDKPQYLSVTYVLSVWPDVVYDFG